MGHAHALVIMPTFDLNPTTDSASLNNTSNPAGEVAAIETAMTRVYFNRPGLFDEKLVDVSARQ
jgi:hypothetical protein